ncbi:MAG TPA: 23S rRNA (guanosine(2251)-2'-O)-methyltransferase RlmB [bacterium]|nr:23S rRNA (guanosine(2251)-2'-O)-methyltransferase RlmB [bacterium]HPN44658.1 23S rRNA (guanosine(2251)-2'-O)-methyltransferase RlmB [bacterium]
MIQIIYGRNAVLEWFYSGLSVTQILMTADMQMQTAQKMQEMARQRQIPVKTMNRQQLTQIAGSENHQGIAAKVTTPDYAELEDLLLAAENKQEKPFIAILDGIQDPHNLGAIIRSADGAGVHGLVIPKDQSVDLTPTVIKASAGAAAHVPVVKATNIARLMDELKEKGFWITGVDQEGDKNYAEADYTGAIALVLGSEGRGIRRLVREKCDFLVSIPMYGKVNSLNVSVAAALVFFEARKHKKQ